MTPIANQSYDEFIQSPGKGDQIAQFAASALQFAGPYGQLASQFVTTLQAVSQMFGKGRKEADQIVPIQNDYGNLLASANQAVASGVDRETLIHYEMIVAQGYAAFDQFTRDPRFTDGRASKQARQTIRPLVDGRQEDGAGRLVVVRVDGGTLGTLQRAIDAQGGGGSYIDSPSGLLVNPAGRPEGSAVIGGIPSAPSGTAAAGGNGLLYAGGAVLAAKLAGLW